MLTSPTGAAKNGYLNLRPSNIADVSTPDRNWGYIQFKSSKEVTDEYEKYAKQLLTLIKRGFSAAVYTQTTDVEVEVNGVMTYDRKVMKMDEARIRRINSEICNSLNK